MRIFGEPVADGVKVIVVVQAKATVSDVIIDGASEIKESRIRKEITIKPNDTLNEAQVAQDRQKILDYYAGKGFTEVDVQATTQVDEKTGRARVTFTINEGGKTVDPLGEV